MSDTSGAALTAEGWAESVLSWAERAGWRVQRTAGRELFTSRCEGVLVEHTDGVFRVSSTTYGVRTRDEFSTNSRHAVDTFVLLQLGADVQRRAGHEPTTLTRRHAELLPAQVTLEEESSGGPVLLRWGTESWARFEGSQLYSALRFAPLVAVPLEQLERALSTPGGGELLISLEEIQRLRSAGVPLYAEGPPVSWEAYMEHIRKQKDAGATHE